MFALFEQREVQECGPPGGGELELQSAFDRYVPESCARGDRVSAGAEGWGEGDPGRGHHV